MSVLWSVIKTYFHLLSFVDAVCSIQYSSFFTISDHAIRDNLLNELSKKLSEKLPCQKSHNEGELYTLSYGWGWLCDNNYKNEEGTEKKIQVGQ